MNKLFNLIINIFSDEKDPKGDNGHLAFSRSDKELISSIYRNPTSINIHKTAELELQRRLANRLYRVGIFTIIATSIFGMIQIIILCVK